MGGLIEAPPAAPTPTALSQFTAAQYFQTDAMWNASGLTGQIRNIGLFGETTSGTVTFVNQPPNPAGGSFFGSALLQNIASAAAINSAANALWFGPGMMLGFNGAADSFFGFNLNMIFGWSNARADSQAFAGAVVGNAIVANTNASALLNCIGIGKDNADADLFFIYNNGAGVATKVDLGIPFANYNNHLLLLNINAPFNGGAIVSLTDFESGGNPIKALNILATDPKLPVSTAVMQTQVYVSTGGTAAAMSIAFKKFTLSTGNAC